MECFVIFVIAWFWFNATESKSDIVMHHHKKIVEIMDYMIVENDIVKISELHRKIPLITKKLIISENAENIYYPIKKEIKLIYKRNEIPSREQKENLKKVRLNYDIAHTNYLESLREWNDEMDKIIERYDYLTLKKFLTKNPLKSIGINPNLTFSVNIKNTAVLMNVPILLTLYSGEPKFLNNYPEKWLSKVYKEVDKMSTIKDYKLDLNDLE